MNAKALYRALGGMLVGALALLWVGSPEAYTIPIGHISNGSGAVETGIKVLDFGGGLKSRFSANEIRPGEREVVAIAVALCDGGDLVNSKVTILPSIVSGTPSIAGGIAAIPCLNVLGGTDGFHTGINGAVVTFSGPLSQFMGTIRMYADTDRDGTLFEANDLIQQAVPVMQGTAEAVAQFGKGQGQMFNTPQGTPLAALDPASLPPFPIPIPVAGPINPLILVFTVDVNSAASGGRVEVALGLQVGDDTAQKGAGFCAVRLPLTFQPFANCGSNLRGNGPETSFFNIVGSGGGSTNPGPTPPSTGGSSLRSYDANSSCTLDDSEFFTMIDSWISSSIGNELFFAAVDAWIGQTSICGAAASASVKSLELSSINLRAGFESALLVVKGQNIASTEMEVFSLNGKSVYQGSAGSSALRWNLRASDGKLLANGVYLYRITVFGHDGQTIQSEVKKFVISR